MAFELIDGRDDVRDGGEFFEVMLQKIAYTDRTNLSRCEKILHVFPRIDKFAGHRPVNQIQIDVIEFEFVEAFVERVFLSVVSLILIPHLCRNENLRPLEASRRRLSA